ncbi:hypothetical protein T09_6724 [Trichinella sp. T9]|nr:hypothetical protein T09_6724 [Trichinella sp. T9]KRZ96682.1 hypothetical protein T08_14465 [Trichinella sp. T8]
MGEDSKRKPLNTAFRIFDPGGCFAPSTVRVKMLLQILWQAGASWNDPLPRNVKEQWTRWKKLLKIHLPLMRSYRSHLFK